MSLIKHKYLIIDIEESKIIDTNNGKVMSIDFLNMVYKDFSNRRDFQPIKFNSNNELFFWYKETNQPSWWFSSRELYSSDVTESIKILIENKIEKDLLS